MNNLHALEILKKLEKNIRKANDYAHILHMYLTDPKQFEADKEAPQSEVSAIGFEVENPEEFEEYEDE
ncbi:MAG: hypothetical protein R3Y32_08720 [Bacillota bacterium]